MIQTIKKWTEISDKYLQNYCKSCFIWGNSWSLVENPTLSEKFLKSSESMITLLGINTEKNTVASPTNSAESLYKLTLLGINTEKNTDVSPTHGVEFFCHHARIPHHSHGSVTCCVDTKKVTHRVTRRNCCRFQCATENVKYTGYRSSAMVTKLQVN